MTPAAGPEQQAREQIDTALVDAGWVVQDRDEANLSAGRGVAIREFEVASGDRFADCVLFMDRLLVGAPEPAKLCCGLSRRRPLAGRRARYARLRRRLDQGAVSI